MSCGMLLAEQRLDGLQATGMAVSPDEKLLVRAVTCSEGRAELRVYSFLGDGGDLCLLRTLGSFGKGDGRPYRRSAQVSFTGRGNLLVPDTASDCVYEVCPDTGALVHCLEGVPAPTAAICVDGPELVWLVACGGSSLRAFDPARGFAPLYSRPCPAVVSFAAVPGECSRVVAHVLRTCSLLTLDTRTGKVLNTHALTSECRDTATVAVHGNQLLLWQDDVLEVYKAGVGLQGRVPFLGSPKARVDLREGEARGPHAAAVSSSGCVVLDDGGLVRLYV